MDQGLRKRGAVEHGRLREGAQDVGVGRRWEMPLGAHFILCVGGKAKRPILLSDGRTDNVSVGIDVSHSFKSGG